MSLRRKARHSDYDRQAKRRTKVWEERGLTAGDERTGCTGADGKPKHHYLTRDAAKKVRDRMVAEGFDKELRAYRCGGHFHVGHDRRAT